MMFSVTRFTAVLLLALSPITAYAGDKSETVLITGANRGVGLALAAAFKDAGYNVMGTARKPAAASALRELKVKVVQLDVTEPDSVARMARDLDGQTIDILINNAGILSKEPAAFADVDVESLFTEYNVNSLGPMRVTQALLPNVLASERKVVANISSMMGSQQLNTFGCCMGYRASKAALNSFTKTLAVDYAGDGAAFVVLHPGYVRTDMNGGEGRITAAQSAAGLLDVIQDLSADDNGKFLNYDGQPMPW